MEDAVFLFVNTYILQPICDHTKTSTINNISVRADNSFNRHPDDIWFLFYYYIKYHLLRYVMIKRDINQLKLKIYNSLEVVDRVSEPQR